MTARSRTMSNSSAESCEDDRFVKSTSQEALEAYCSRFGVRPRVSSEEIIDRNRFPWHADMRACEDRTREEQVMPKLDEDIGPQQISHNRLLYLPYHQKESAARRFRTEILRAQDSDGDDVRVCQECNLPLGDFVHNRNKDCVHAECKAQLMAKEAREKEEEWLRHERLLKDKQHKEYGIGWKVQHIPRNDKAASKFAMRAIPQGMLCLILEPSSHTVSMASTTEPSAAINLEYLSIALQVRRMEGIEPMFSLDPIEANDRSCMQKKVFTPKWLADTRVGEVLFQSDYYLKELSMGEIGQPVVGMKSCFDLSEISGDHNWSAREWFLVRKAEVNQLSDTGVLRPVVKLGVEAREQMVVGRSLEDKPITRKDHPMVLYADKFTKNFDLIAERRSVIYHLRELAKASVMAKYLLTSQIEMGDSWFGLADGTFANEKSCCLEVPQLWNERSTGQICTDDRCIAGGALIRSQLARTHGVYGGVRFGLEKFRLGASRAPAASLSAAVPHFGRVTSGTVSVAAVPQRLAFGLSRTQGILSMAPLAGGTSSMAQPPGVKPPFAPAGVPFPRIRPGPLSRHGSATGRTIIAPGVDPLKGVDLRLDKFDLTQTKIVEPEAQKGSWRTIVGSLDECVALGRSFFTALDDSQKIFKEADCILLKQVFNPALSDRRCEGDLFIPPDAGFAYVHKLRDLVKGEDLVRTRRKESFISKEFNMADPGSLFPYSWTPSFQFAGGQMPGRSQCSSRLQERTVSKDEASALLLQMRNNSSLVFDRQSEEGARFRIYKLGSLEIRTIQELDSDEVVGVVFSTMIKNLILTSQNAMADEHERIARVIEYVEHSEPHIAAASPLPRHYYLVLEAENGQKIVTERLSNGTLTWVADAKDLDDRSCFAKVTRSKAVNSGVTFKDMQAFRVRLAEGVTPSDKRYTQAAFIHAVVFDG